MSPDLGWSVLLQSVLLLTLTDSRCSARLHWYLAVTSRESVSLAWSSVQKLLYLPEPHDRYFLFIPFHQVFILHGFSSYFWLLFGEIVIEVMVAMCIIFSSNNTVEFVEQSCSFSGSVPNRVKLCFEVSRSDPEKCEVYYWANVVMNRWSILAGPEFVRLVVTKAMFRKAVWPLTSNSPYW